jgi:hypothetical protein
MTKQVLSVQPTTELHPQLLQSLFQKSVFKNQWTHPEISSTMIQGHPDGDYISNVWCSQIRAAPNEAEIFTVHVRFCNKDRKLVLLKSRNNYNAWIPSRWCYCKMLKTSCVNKYFNLDTVRVSLFIKVKWPNSALGSISDVVTVINRMCY